MFRFIQLSVSQHLKRPVQNVRLTPIKPLRLQNRPITSGVASQSIHQDFRYVGTEKNAGALQDLLRRVMEIDADITNTPVVEFKPNTQECIAYNIDDVVNLGLINNKLAEHKDFKIQKTHVNMLHVLDTQLGGDIFLFSNGTLVCWGLNQERQKAFLGLIREDIASCNETREKIEYTVDEDEVTDVKGDIIILNPYLPSIESSKVAFSYGFGRAAKLNGLEKLMDSYLDKFFSEYSHLNKSDLFKQLLLIHRKLLQNSQDGFLDTPEFHWAKPELEEYVNKISRRFDIQTRITILNKKLDYARNLITTASELDVLEKK